MKTKIKIKALSVNKAWKGRRIKTDDYNAFEKELYYLLPPMKINCEKIELWFVIGFSSKLSDLSNPLKLIEDILQMKYDFNDNIVYRIVMEKEIVKKGEEYIEFEIKEYI